MNILLWVFQILLALVFLLAGGMKLVVPSDVLMKMGPPTQVQLPGLFLKFIGLCEVLGALGLILPGIFRKRRELTPLAAAGLSIIMIGAIVVTLIGIGVFAAATPFVVLFLTAFVGYARWKVVPLK